MTTLYFLPRTSIAGNIASLPPEEAHHAVNVVRHKVGDVIYAVDGEGGFYTLQLTGINKRFAEGEILDTQYDVGEPSFQLTVGMAILKNQKRFDLFVEKAVELGVCRIIPLVTARTEKKTLKEARVQKILTAAMKQCGRSRMIELADVKSLNEILDDEKDSLLLCCHEKESSDSSLYFHLNSYLGHRNVRILIGPEGGFTENEIRLLESRGYKIVSLGSRRLRAETAAIVASTGVMLHWS